MPKHENEVLLTGIKMDPPLFEDAVGLQKSGHLLEAIEAFRSLAAEYGDKNLKASVMINEVRCYADLERIQDAENVLRQIRELAPDDHDVLFHVDFGAACVAAQGGQHQKAAGEFDAILRNYADVLEPVEYRDLYEEVRYRKALSLLYLGRKEEALPLLKEATTFETLSTVVQQRLHLYVGILYAELHEHKLAKDEFSRVVEFNLKNAREADARYRLAALYFQLGGSAHAKQHLQWLLHNDGIAESTVRRDYVYLLLSRVCEQLGEKADARRYKELGNALQH